jgi:hypothetical protein
VPTGYQPAESARDCFLVAFGNADRPCDRLASYRNASQRTVPQRNGNATKKDMTDTWKECGWAPCRKRFEPRRRSNQYRHAGGAQHGGAVYCSRGCQQKAYRWRLQASQNSAPCTTTQATVTRGSEPIENIVRFSTKNEHARPVISLLDGYARSDWKPCWPGHPSGWQPVIDLAATPGDGLDIPGFLGRTTVRNEPMREAA